MQSSKRVVWKEKFVQNSGERLFIKIIPEINSEQRIKLNKNSYCEIQF
jgi:hypothetical protein